MISSFLERHENLDNIQQDFTIYILLLYLFVERAETVFDILKVPDSYREKHFKVFQQIRRWANFIKHPKAFVLTHHSDYDFNNSRRVHDSKYTIINEQFIDKYYKGYSDIGEQKSINNDLYKKLKNNSKVVVLFPDPTVLTQKFCYSYKKFVDLIVKNEVYIEILKDEATTSYFFENEESTGATSRGIEPHL